MEKNRTESSQFTKAALERQAKESSVLAEIGRAATRSENFADVFEATVVEISQLVQFDRIAIASIDTETGTSRTRFISGVSIDGFDLRAVVDGS